MEDAYMPVYVFKLSIWFLCSSILIALIESKYYVKLNHSSA